MMVVASALVLDALGGFAALHHWLKESPASAYSGCGLMFLLSVPLWATLPYFHREVRKEAERERAETICDAMLGQENSRNAALAIAQTTVDRIRLARSPGDRRYILKRALATIEDDDVGEWLASQAAQVEVSAAHEKARRLRSPAAKARVYRAAAQAMRDDDVPDEHQADAIAELEAAAHDAELLPPAEIWTLADGLLQHGPNEVRAGHPAQRAAGVHLVHPGVESGQDVVGHPHGKRREIGLRGVVSSGCHGHSDHTLNDTGARVNRCGICVLTRVRQGARPW